MKLSDVKSQGVTGVFLRPGDSVTAGATHEILINGDKSWVKFEATTHVGDDETAEQARDRIIRYTNDAVMEAIQVAVDTVMAASNNQTLGGSA